MAVKGFIYAIRSPTAETIYIGSSQTTAESRWKAWKSQAKQDYLCCPLLLSSWPARKYRFPRLNHFSQNHQVHVAGILQQCMLHILQSAIKEVATRSSCMTRGALRECRKEVQRSLGAGFP